MPGICDGNCVERNENAVRERCAALRRQAVDRGQDGIRVVRRGLHRKATVAEGDDADLHAARLALHEVPRGGFGRFHPRRLQIVGRHAAGNINRKDDRAFLPRQADDRLGACQRDHQDREAEKKERRRDVAAQTEPAPRGLLHESKTAVTRGKTPPPPLQHDVQHDAQWNQQQ